jgi:hypothetical protein
MDTSFSNLEQMFLTSSVKLSNAWLVEFVRQNYLYIIIFLVFLFFVWLIGLMIKNWIWKIDRISNSLEKIAMSLDSLTKKEEEQKEEITFTEKSLKE